MPSVSGYYKQKLDRYRRKSILMLATLMASATYVAGFSPPGGVWQDTGGHLPGDPIMRSTDYDWYVVFFYFNAAAFALSLMVVVLTLVLTAFLKNKTPKSAIDWLLRLLMLTATSAFMAAYCTGACRDKFRVVVFSVLVGIVLYNVVFQSLLVCNFCCGDDEDSASEETPENYKFRKLMAPLSMFALTIAYVGGLSTPGGFWDSAEGGHRPGDGILHGKLLHLFSYFNIAAFISSLYGVFLVMGEGVQVQLASIGMFTGQLGLIISYTVGSSRGRHATVGVICSLCAAIGAYVMLHVWLFTKIRRFWEKLCAKVMRCFDCEPSRYYPRCFDCEPSSENNDRGASLVQLLAGLAVSITYQAGMYPPGGVWQDGHKAGDPILLTTNGQRYQAFFYSNTFAFVASLLAIFLAQKSYLNKHHALQAAMLLDLLALIVAYAIGSCRDQISSMYAVGIAGAAVVYVVVHVQYFTLGSADKKGEPKDKKGEPKEETKDDALVDEKGEPKEEEIEDALVDEKGEPKEEEIQDGAVVDKKGEAKEETEDDAQVDKKGEAKEETEDDALVDKKRGRFLLFSILVSSITYQAGLTPPGGFLLQDDIQSGHRAGDPVLLYNYPRRYKAFFYCNSVSFMVSTVLIFFLVNPNLYRPAIRSHALSLCSAVSFMCLIGAFAAGSTQHMKTSIYIFVLAAVAFFLSLLLLFTIYVVRGGLTDKRQSTNKGKPDRDPKTRKMVRDPKTRKMVYLMTLAILVGSVTYQAGLDPPGGSWQSTRDGHDAGNQVMHDNRRGRYMTFLYGNSTSFVASIYLIELLLFSMWCPNWKWLEVAIQPTVVAQYLGFLVAYAAGSSRQWKMSAHVGTLVIAVLAYVATHVMLSHLSVNLQKKKPKESPPPSAQGQV